MEKFRLKGIAAPGIVDMYKHGRVVLSEISDEKAEELIKDGCPYLEPVPDAPPPKRPIEADRLGKGNKSETKPTE